MQVDILLSIGAMLCAMLAGWSFGRTVPNWQIDAMNEDSSRYAHDTEAGCGGLVWGFMQGAWGTIAWGAAALFLSVYGWGGFPFLDDIVNLPLEPLVALLAAALAGYVISRLTDKGPVGPLE